MPSREKIKCIEVKLLLGTEITEPGLYFYIPALYAYEERCFITEIYMDETINKLCYTREDGDVRVVETCDHKFVPVKSFLNDERIQWDLKQKK
jgi:hypothetical protein